MKTTCPTCGAGLVHDRGDIFVEPWSLRLKAVWLLLTRGAFRIVPPPVPGEKGGA